MKRKLINSFLLLASSTIITKVFSLINRMLLSRFLSIKGMTLYFLIIPTVSLCITLAQFSIPSAVFRLISHPKYDNRKIIISASLLCGISCGFIMISLLIFAKPIAIYLLKEKQAYYPLIAILPFIPLVGVSGIIKNYYLGKEDFFHLCISQFLEELSRIVFTYFFIKKFSYANISILVTIAILSMSIGELSSILYLFYHINSKFVFFHNNQSFFHKDFLFKDILNIALPLTGSRLLHTCYNFIEPILLVTILTKLGINKNEIHLSYGIINGYVITLLLTPTFFNNIILRILIPILNRDTANQNKSSLQKHIIYGLIASFCISLPFTFIFYFYGDKCLSFIYNTTQGYQYLKYMSIPFTLFYLQTPLSATLQVLNKNKQMFYISTLEIIIEFIFLIILMPFFHVFTVAIVLLIGLLTTLILSSYYVYKYVYK